ncbi:MAG TPA: hypothetical protein DEE98_02560 [Elusimicrobia bacterium]|nr:MAG: hypothetical protein A2278_07390 [Elusimicrobia bacterium RIFOXYA12_FULL_49_49]OGS09755.1 MAG: hypothetical protein A2386_03770 [Elusimicrobia bacterium RIFOXYB1_FULL_48_9]OGS16110.1 MAG: hypothetical protein A2251_02875 [Elusimicrobia bacterium RIFOXYA2_FULL_47_53]OGS26736.1 MAG: hypothetical protein A2339_03925 [Elusimicrobia bacterium RIFOXYB12_FULL_50_12]OGS30138.1 MAG: hypothetical protein A2323_01660 [Elusimicrobia bacterium RIFOXYB2_FULL_46_23]HBU69246.1 hypothetical protein [El
MLKIKLFAAFLIFFLSQNTFASPARIVSLAPSVTKSVMLLGSSSKLAGITTFCPDPSGSIDKIGTVLEPNIEKIVSLKPDLVIASKEGNLPGPVEKLRKLGIKVYVMDAYRNFDDICLSFIELGKVIGREAEAEKIVTNSKARIDAVKKKTLTLSRPAIFWEIGAQPLYTVSDKSFVNDFIEFAGANNIFADMPIAYPQVSREEVLVRNPDMIFIVMMGDINENERSSWQKYGTLKAVKTGNIHILNDLVFLEPTPEAFAEGTEKLNKVIFEKKGGAGQ